MMWKTWGAMLLACACGAVPAQAGLFDGCHNDSYPGCVAQSYDYGCYSPIQPYCAPAGCGEMNYCAPCEERSCFGRCFDKMWDLEHRKNRWLKRTFFGCGHDDCYDYCAPSSCGPTPYYGGQYNYSPAPACNCN